MSALPRSAAGQAAASRCNRVLGLLNFTADFSKALGCCRNYLRSATSRCAACPLPAGRASHVLVGQIHSGCSGKICPHVLRLLRGELRPVSSRQMEERERCPPQMEPLYPALAQLTREMTH